MHKYSTAVIGGGASGIMAAISAGRAGRSVVICERMSRPGKKILVSGNGRCNIYNDVLHLSAYNGPSQQLVRSVFDRFGLDKIKRFFKDLGLETYSQDGRVFPVTNQAATVLHLLEIELRRLSVPIETGFDVTSIEGKNGAYRITGHSGRSIIAEKVVIAGGGRTYPSLGADGSAYKLAERFGHTIIEPVPVGVALNVKNRLCHILQGQKISAVVSAYQGGRKISEAEGDLLFTKYGLSGTAILDVSAEVSIAMNRDMLREVTLSVDMIPFMSNSELLGYLEMRSARQFRQEEIFVGILPDKFGPALKDEFKGLPPRQIATHLKSMRFKVDGTRGWNEADFTAGGVSLDEIDHKTLQSKIGEGLFFSGEVIDVHGKRGGYNLAWAWASGFVAGLAG